MIESDRVSVISICIFLSISIICMTHCQERQIKQYHEQEMKKIELKCHG